MRAFLQFVGVMVGKSGFVDLGRKFMGDHLDAARHAAATVGAGVQLAGAAIGGAPQAALEQHYLGVPADPPYEIAQDMGQEFLADRAVEEQHHQMMDSMAPGPGGF